MADFYRFYCSHCGELCRGKYCNTCKTVAGRHEVDKQNAIIKKENISKGYKYATTVVRENS